MKLLHIQPDGRRICSRGLHFRDLRLQTHFAKTRSGGVTKYFPFEVTKQAHKIPHHDPFPPVHMYAPTVQFV